jgi:hypothetical protein
MSLSQADQDAVDRVVELLRPARRLLFITGAGLSADSGLPTYRSVGGLYDAGRTTQRRDEQPVPLHRRAGAAGQAVGNSDGGDQPGVDGRDVQGRCQDRRRRGGGA